MNDFLVEKIGSQKRLMEILGCSREQAWRIWTGRSSLTKVNEKYLLMVIRNEEEAPDPKVFK